ncbi:MAG: nucleotidyltransferase [Nanoarchaeota archaeon]
MISEFKQIEELFKDIDNVLHHKIKVYTIGGAVLLEQGLKIATKDIDVVVETKKEFVELQHSLQKIGFKSQSIGKEYSRMNLSQIFQRGEFRIDLFEKEVCGGFSLSKGMIGRARKVISLDHIEVYLCSNEDIFLFKAMTEREGDLTDCESLVGAAVGWDIIIDELKSQIKMSKQDVWITWVGERLDILEDRGMVIPIMNDLNILRNKFFDEFEKRHSSN